MDLVPRLEVVMEDILQEASGALVHHNCLRPVKPATLNQETGSTCLTSARKIASGRLLGPKRPLCVPIALTSVQEVPAANIRRTFKPDSASCSLMARGVGHVASASASQRLCSYKMNYGQATLEL